MKNFIILFVCLFSLGGSSQEYKCGYYGKKTVAERNKIFPFNKTKKIVLISYSNYESGSELAGIMSLDEARAINPNIIRKYDFAFHEDMFAKIYFAKEEKELDENSMNELSNILCNYTVKAKLKEGYIIGIANCYTPRNSILFFDESNNIICYMEICFQCGGTNLSPDLEDLNKYADVPGCRGRLDEIKKIFSKNGIVYGIKD